MIPAVPSCGFARPISFRRHIDGPRAAGRPASGVRRGRPQACWPTAMDGELGARGRAAQPPGRRAAAGASRRLPRCARRRAPIGTPHTGLCAPLPGPLAAAHRRAPWSPVAEQVAGPRAAATTERRVCGASASARVPKAQQRRLETEPSELRSDARRLALVL